MQPTRGGLASKVTQGPSQIVREQMRMPLAHYSSQVQGSGRLLSLGF